MARRESPVEVDVTVKEIIGRQFLRRLPDDLFKRKARRFTKKLGNTIKNKEDGRSTWIPVLIPDNLLPNGRFNSKLFPEFPSQARCWCFAPFHLAAWELPLQSVGIAALPLAD